MANTPDFIFMRNNKFFCKGEYNCRIFFSRGVFRDFFSERVIHDVLWSLLFAVSVLLPYARSNGNKGKIPRNVFELQKIFY